MYVSCCESASPFTFHHPKAVLICFWWGSLRYGYRLPVNYFLCQVWVVSRTIASLYKYRRRKNHVILNYYDPLVQLISPWTFNNNNHKLPTILLTKYPCSFTCDRPCTAWCSVRDKWSRCVNRHVHVRIWSFCWKTKQTYSVCTWLGNGEFSFGNFRVIRSPVLRICWPGYA